MKTKGPRDSAASGASTPPKAPESGKEKRSY